MVYFYYMCCIFLCTPYSVYTFNLEELKWINYEVDISAIPLKREEANHPSVHITSRNGQEFQCILPQLNEEEISEKEVVNEKDIDVLELLKPMKTGSCLSKNKDWWTYEFCFGHHIKQFHVEDGEIIGEVLTLGLYESDINWNNETTNEERFRHTKQKYHSQYYTNGTKCDITGQPRNAEVRIFCEEGSFDYIYRVDEPGTCSYIITVHTSRLCSHPLLRPVPSNKAHQIKCHPLLNEEQYSSYLLKIKEKALAEEKLAQEKLSQFLSKQHEHLQVMKKEKNVLSDDDKTEKLPPDGSKTLKSTKKTFEIVHEFLLQEYDKEMEKLKTLLPAEKFASVKKDIQEQFNAILEEAKKDFISDLSEEAKDASLAKLTSVLNVLLEKLDNAEKEAVKSTKELNKANSPVSDDHVPDPEDDNSHLDSQKKDTNQNTENDLYEDALKVVSSETSRTAVLDDDKLQVRIRRLDRKSDSSGKLQEMDFEQRKKLEQAVKEKLEKAGLDTGGRRIEVKIITAGYYDSEDGKDFQSLTDEETDQFQNMIMALLTGQQEAVQEMKRHKNLEENYKFTWDDKEEIDNKDD